MYRKIVITQGIIEITEYEKLNVLAPGGYKEGEGANREENYKQTQRNRRNSIRQLICTNFDSGSKFVTLTFDNDQAHDIKDVKECNKEFKKYIQKMRWRYKDFKYVAVIEFQDKNHRGAVHYHMVCNLPYIKKSELTEIWGNGHVKINAIDKVDNIGAYVIKYMTTDLDDKRLMGLKAYNSSKGLERPIEVKSWDNRDSELLLDFESRTKNKTPSYFGEYESEYAGKITFKQFNFNRKSTT